jgi:glutamate synthase domain-containing protein 2
VVLPDPTLPEIKAAFKDGAIKEFERHSRLGFVTKEDFMKEVRRLRRLGFKRITLKTGAYSAVELAMAIRFCADAKIDLLTVDGAPGGTGMSPWPMMSEWGIPSLYLHALTYQFCEELRKKKIRVPDIAFAGGFSSEDGVFKALALGAPYVKAVCMGRALMIPAMVGKNISEWIKNKDLPKTVSKYGESMEEIFVCYEELKKKFGKEMAKIPAGALGFYSYSQKFKTGLQQLMAGSRNFNLSTITRKDIMALTEDAAKVTGIPYVMDAYLREAKRILSK